VELHPATLWEAHSDLIGDRLALVRGSTRRTWQELDDRAARLAGAMLGAGVEPGSRVGLLLHNCTEFVEAYFAALKIRAVPFNVNFRYTGEEIAYLLGNADAEVLVFHSSLGEVVAGALAAAGPLRLLVEVDDGGARLPTAARFEDVVASAAPAARTTRSPDDTTMAYTGGTTGMPKGVVSRVGPGIEGLLQVVPPMIGRPGVTIDEAPALAAGLDEWMVSLPAPPLIHSTGLGIGVLPAFATGGTVVLLEGRSFDAAELWDTVAAERVNAVTVVGDPFARPMLAELDATAATDAAPSRDLTCVRSISSSGAMFSAEVKTGLLGHLPGAMIIDLIASTEGTMGMSISTAAAPVETARFRPGRGVIVVTEDGRQVAPGSGEAGLVAVPGGADRYHKDEAKSAATFRTIDGQRYTVPGDYATIDADGSLVLLGRGSSCINTAGEKVYPEEVEETLKRHPAVEDALVFGVPDDRYGQRVAAVWSRTPGTDDPYDTVLEEARSHLAGYKLPHHAVEVDRIPRTSVGKPDYPTARDLYAAAADVDAGDAADAGDARP
jgi:acyl-CoA synthetase (AMP-forming)/AMP-acid ligase II